MSDLRPETLLGMTYHFTYMIVCILNGRYYYGRHSTRNLNDGYKGSGKVIRQAVQKYGWENFVLVPIQFYNTKEELKAAEAELITDEVIEDFFCYNISRGGHGGHTGNYEQVAEKLRGVPHTEERKKRLAESIQISKLNPTKKMLEGYKKQSETLKNKKDNPFRKGFFGDKNPQRREKRHREFLHEFAHKLLKRGL